MPDNEIAKGALGWRKLTSHYHEPDVITARVYKLPTTTHSIEHAEYDDFQHHLCRIGRSTLALVHILKS